MPENNPCWIALSAFLESQYHLTQNHQVPEVLSGSSSVSQLQLVFVLTWETINDLFENIKTKPLDCLIYVKLFEVILRPP